MIGTSFFFGDVVVVVVVVIVVILSFDQVLSQMNVTHAHEPLPMVRVSCFSFIGDLDGQNRYENQRDDFDIRHFQVHNKSEKTSMIYKIYKTTSIRKKRKKIFTLSVDTCFSV